MQRPSGATRARDPENTAEMTTSNTTPMDPRLLELGRDDSLAGAAASPGDGLPGRVTGQQRGRYRVATAAGGADAVIAGRLRARGRNMPVVGDWVMVAESGHDGAALILDVLARRTALVRRRAGSDRAPQVIAANVDVVLVTVASTEPLNARRLERYVSLAWESGAVPLVVLSKIDLCDGAARAMGDAESAVPGVDVVAISALGGDGLQGLRDRLRPRSTVVLLGQSGAGKSTLINALLGEERLRTGAVRRDGKGQHTTTSRELVRLPGGALLIDTPGLREVGLWRGDEGVRRTFDDLAELAGSCRFRDCRHEAEPGCAILAAVGSGEVEHARLEAWRRLQRELDHVERKEDPAERRAYDRALHREYRRVSKLKNGR